VPRARAAGDHFEVVKIGPEWCLRVRATKQPVAWSKKDDAAWRSYVAEAERDALSYPQDV
jgi:hypothetical protein